MLWDSLFFFGVHVYFYSLCCISDAYYGLPQYYISMHVHMHTSSTTAKLTVELILV